MRLLAGGGPGTPDARVLRALATPLIGQFDPAFTEVMDDVVQFGRETLLTGSPHCFAVSALAAGALEGAINSLLEPGATIAIGGSQPFVERTADMARRYGATPVPVDARADVIVVPAVDPFTCEKLPLKELAARAHANAGLLVVDATLALGATELRVDGWGLDVCVAGADYGVGAPSGMSLVTYAPEVQARMQQRARPPSTQYLDLLQLQAYWSSERLNHHTAPTALVYSLREALCLLCLEGLTERWRRHAEVGGLLRRGLAEMGLTVSGELPYSVVQLADASEAERLREQLREGFGVSVTRLAPTVWRLGLLGADAHAWNVERLLGAFEKAGVA